MKKIVTIILSILLGLGLLTAATYVFILAPTFRHDKERLAIQKDESMMSEIENVISIKLANQEIYETLLKDMELNLTESDNVEIDVLLVSKINGDETEYSLGKSIMTCSENEKVKYLKDNETFHNAIVSVIGDKHNCVSKKYQGMDYRMSVTLDSRGMNYTDITGEFLQHDNDKINKLVNSIKEESKINNEDTDGDKNIYINDFADLLTDIEETTLKAWAYDECSNLNYNILFLTTNDTDEKSTMVYSNDYMDEMFPDTAENIAFIIDMYNREIYINTMGTAIQLIDDSEIDAALDAGFEKIKNEDYYGCFKEMAKYCFNILVEQ